MDEQQDKSRNLVLKVEVKREFEPENIERTLLRSQFLPAYKAAMPSNTSG